MTDTEAQHPLRPFLKYWIREHGPVQTHYLDCSNGEIKVDEGRKARFAAATIFYVSLAKDTDDKAHAAAPSIQEGNLARFLNAAQTGNAGLAGSQTDVQRAAQDCVELGIVCAYQQDAHRALARYAQEAMFEDEIRAAVVNDIRRSYAGLREQLALYDFTVFHGLPTPLFINETPFIDWRLRARPAQPFVSMPLGPHCLLVGTPSGKKSRAGPVQWKNVASMGPFKDHNRYIVEDAHAWLVATTADQLVGVQSRFVPAAPTEPKATKR